MCIFESRAVSLSLQFANPSEAARDQKLSSLVDLPRGTYKLQYGVFVLIIGVICYSLVTLLCAAVLRSKHF